MDDMWGIVIVGIMAAWVSIIITAFVLEGAWEAEAIENNCAHYDVKTAEFTWNKK